MADPRIGGEQTLIGPTPDALTPIAGQGSIQNLDSDWNGSDGGPLPQLWDTRTHTFTGILPAGTTSYRVQYKSFGDCIVWQAHVLSAH
jgi:hypothetical protein